MSQLKSAFYKEENFESDRITLKGLICKGILLYIRGVNLYGFPVSLTYFCDLHGLTDIYYFAETNIF